MKTHKLSSVSVVDLRPQQMQIEVSTGLDTNAIGLGLEMHTNWLAAGGDATQSSMRQLEMAAAVASRHSRQQSEAD